MPRFGTGTGVVSAVSGCPDSSGKGGPGEGAPVGTMVALTRLLVGTVERSRQASDVFGDGTDGSWWCSNRRESGGKELGMAP